MRNKKLFDYLFVRNSNTNLKHLTPFYFIHSLSFVKLREREILLKKKYRRKQKFLFSIRKIGIVVKEKETASKRFNLARNESGLKGRKEKFQKSFLHFATL